MLLAGPRHRALASQLGSVTVSSVPDEQSGEVGGLQNTVTNLGISIGTALAGAVLIAALTSSFFTGIEDNPAVPSVGQGAGLDRARGRRPVHLRRRPRRPRSTTPGVPPRATDAIVDENEDARLDGLRTALAVLALLALVALFLTGRIPTEQPAAAAEPAAAT